MYFIRTDHIGRPVLATDALGAVASSISHKPFGEVHTSTGLDTGLRFPGQVYHWESELHQNWMRDYDPTTGRYIQTDPLGLEPGPALYSYAYQSPGKFVDPDGRNPSAGVYYGVVYGSRLLSAGGRLLAKYWARGRGATAVGAAAAVTPTIPSDNDGAIPDDATPDGEMCEPDGSCNPSDSPFWQSLRSYRGATKNKWVAWSVSPLL